MNTFRNRALEKYEKEKIRGSYEYGIWMNGHFKFMMIYILYFKP